MPHGLCAADTVSDHWPLVLELVPVDEVPRDGGGGLGEGGVAGVVVACVVFAMALVALVVCWRARSARASTYVPLSGRSRNYGTELQSGHCRTLCMSVGPASKKERRACSGCELISIRMTNAFIASHACVLRIHCYDAEREGEARVARNMFQSVLRA